MEREIHVELGNIVASEHPVFRPVELDVPGDSIAYFDLSEIEDFFFISGSYMEQSESGFDLFKHAKKLDTLTCKGKTRLILVLETGTEECDIEKSGKIKYGIVNDSILDSDSDGDDIEELCFDFNSEPSPFAEEGEITVEVRARAIVPSFRLYPQVLILEGCKENTMTTQEFEIENTCELSLPIVQRTPKEITYDGDIDIVLGPYQKKTIEIAYHPKEPGEFQYQILFDCLLLNSVTKTLHVISTVSPAEIPANIPRFSTDMVGLRFHKVYAGCPYEKDVVIHNDSSTAYAIEMYNLVAAHSFAEMERPIVEFRSNVHNQFEKKLRYVIEQDDEHNITIKYTPRSLSDTPYNSLQERSFIIAAKITSLDTNISYYKFIKCSSLCCKSRVTVSPDKISFGDYILNQKPKEVLITLKNESPLETEIDAISPGKSLSIKPSKAVIPGNSRMDFTVKFLPTRINSDFKQSIKFVNAYNKSEEIRVPVSATIIAGASESMHLMFYRVSSQAKEVQSLDFDFCSCNFPSMQTLTIKNRRETSITIKMSTSLEGQLHIFTDRLSTPHLMGSSTDSISTQDQQGHCFEELADQMKNNSSFFDDPYALFQQVESEEIVRLFERQTDYFNNLLNSDEVESVMGKEIFIPGSTLIQLYSVLVPIPSNENDMKWCSRKGTLSIDLVDYDKTWMTNTESIPPKIIPIEYKVCASSTTLTSYHYNFEKVYNKSSTVKKVYMSNHSALPLLFRIDSPSSTSFYEGSAGIILPYQNSGIPFAFFPQITGILKDEIKIINILNPKDIQTIQIKADVIRRTNFFVTPSQISFDNVAIGSSSTTAEIIITNIYDQVIEIEMANSCMQSTTVKPVIMFQLVKAPEKHLTDNLHDQLEKLEHKLKIAERKRQEERTIELKKLMNDIRGIVQSQPQSALNDFNSRYMDRISFRIGPNQSQAISVQMIPYYMSMWRTRSFYGIDGTISVYEKNQTDYIKAVKFTTKLIPPPNSSPPITGDDVLDVEPKNIRISGAVVHSTYRNTIRITNKSNFQQNFWIISDARKDAIISYDSKQTVQPNETIEVETSFYCLRAGPIEKVINITTATNTVPVHFSACGEYPNVLQFNKESINFGTFGLVSFEKLEQRSSLSIRNISDSELYICVIKNHTAKINIYENDPNAPVLLPIRVDAREVVQLNVVLKSSIDIEQYRQYRTEIVEEKVCIKAFEYEEDAHNEIIGLHEGQGCLFSKDIMVLGQIGRIGVSVSEKVIDFGCLDSIQVCRSAITLKNKSDYVPIDIVSSSSNLIQATPSSISLNGKSQETVFIMFSPQTKGLCNSELKFMSQNPPYQASVKVIAFVDPNVISTSLPKNARSYDELNLNTIYTSNGKIIPKEAKFKISNLTNHLKQIKIQELKVNFYLAPKGTETVTFTFPYDNTDTSSDEFTKKIRIRDSITNETYKIIYINGTFVESVGELSAYECDLGTFGGVNRWEFNDPQVSVINKSAAPLIFSVTPHSPYLTVQKIIGPIDGFSTQKLGIGIRKDLLELCEGRMDAAISFENMNNPANSFTLSVKFLIQHLFLIVSPTSKIDGIRSLILPEFIESTEEISSSMVFHIENAVPREIEVEPSFSPQVEDVISTSIYYKDAELLVNTINLQPNEGIDLRVKVVMKKSLKDWLLDNSSSSHEPRVISKIGFKSSGFDTEELALVYEGA